MTFSGGVLAGTPTQSGTFPVLFTATNEAGSVTQTFTLTVTGFRITTTSLPTLTEGVPYSVQLTAVGGFSTLKWKKTAALPKGLKISKTGVLSGTVNAKNVSPGNYTVSVEVISPKAGAQPKQTATATLSLTIDAGS